MSNFVHLHHHTYYSFLDSNNKISDAVMRAKELGMSHLAITDHNHLGGCVEFKTKCKEAGIMPILGCEMYWTWDASICSQSADVRNEMALNNALAAGAVTEDEVNRLKANTKIPKEEKERIKQKIAPYVYDTSQYHIILLAMNQTGWRNLVKLQSEASKICTFNKRFLCDDNLLEQYNEGIIMTTACIGNAVAELIIGSKISEAERQLDKWHKIFGDRLYLEIQPLNIEKQHLVNKTYIKWSQEKGIPLVATTDVHYTRKEDHDDHDTFLCIGLGTFKDEPNRMRYSNDFWLKSAEEMVESFRGQASTMYDNQKEIDSYMHEVTNAISNTVKIAEKVEEIKIGADKPLFPVIETEKHMSAEKTLTLKCWRNLYRYYKQNPDIDLRQYERRLAEELAVVNSKGFAPYMLIVEEYVNWANQNGVPTGPGRGSAAGSLILFLLGITKKIDPIKYGLLFSRFLTADRTSPPDWKQVA